MRYMAVLQTGQLPLVADLPFFMVTWVGFCMSRLVRHLRQYACIGYPSPFCLRGPLPPMPLHVRLTEPAPVPARRLASASLCSIIVHFCAVSSESEANCRGISGR